MIAIDSPSGSASFQYDALGRRIEKTINGVTTAYLYDGAQVIAELRGGSLDTVYQTGGLLDEVLALYGPSGDRSLLSDALMSVIGQTVADGNGSVASFYVYSPYGESATLGSDNGNNLKYAGREDDGVGLYYYRARYYDPVLKRFLSEDPIGIAGELNLYAYVSAPTYLNDPLGLYAVCANRALGPPVPTEWEEHDESTVVANGYGVAMRSFAGGVGGGLPVPGRRIQPPPVKPEIRMELWLYEWSTLLTTYFLHREVYQKTLAMCNETITDSCGRTTHIYSEFEFDKLLSKTRTKGWRMERKRDWIRRIMDLPV